MRLLGHGTRAQSSVFLILLSVLLSIPLVAGQDPFPITGLPLWSEADGRVQFCVTTQTANYVTSLGCTELSPASCFCVNATASYSIASAISSCVLDIGESASQVTTATHIFADYCLTNANVSAQDETLIQDIPLYKMFRGAGCATDMTSSFSIAHGCDFVTPAPCLCDNATSSYSLAQSMVSCMTDEGIASSLWTSVTLLFSSYCSINLRSPANRTVDGKVEYGPASNSATITAPSSGSTASSTSQESPTAGPTGTSKGQTSSSSPLTTSASSTVTAGSSGLSTGDVIGLVIGLVTAVIGIVTIVVPICIWLYADDKEKVKAYFEKYLCCWRGFRKRRQKDKARTGQSEGEGSSGELQPGQNTIQMRALGESGGGDEEDVEHNHPARS